MPVALIVERCGIRALNEFSKVSRAIGLSSGSPCDKAQNRQR